MSETTLTVAGVKKRFGRKEVVRGVDFSMTTGQVVSLLGPNGAGKTTLFYMVVGFISVTEGQVYLGSREITRLPMFRRALAGISYLPQEPSIFRKLTVEENILAVLELRRDLSRKERLFRADQLLDELGVRALRKQKAFTLSGGERRRTEIARALAIEPKFLLLDEPFAGIDPRARYEIKSICLHLANQGIGILITDHNERDTLEISSYSYLINCGEIVVAGTREEIEADETARRIYLGDDYQR
ncbi:LPS export ABC transporter ATP-binding protein [Alkalispirochaeta sphaeroplastigenens]|uniref:LPS export ABC transporter ATP-binding protein n=1 Tax=Alkalispirochaeta sphaeroplastigenens TaxID=1187066 RepID=A0A2S4JRV2_9SPIO|nr:LPS export ABC transporter ATP-binding protein [Alkalispirochaeta sphaeroplastigenens]POR02269.1 LPS export ABC transporter ATP-binding protein [Alkalispirochaeta sphaeroplastigenens]